MANRYTEAQKQQIIDLYKSSAIPTSELCRNYGIARSSLYLWVEQYSDISPQTKTAREVYLLEKEAEKLRIQNKIFRLSGCSVTSPVKDKLKAVDELKSQFSIHAICNTLELNRSTYYHYALRSPVQTKIEKDDELYKSLIAEIFEKSGKRFGAKKIRVKLMEDGYTISQKRIHRLMKELGLSVNAQKVYPNATFSREYKYYPLTD